MKIDIDKLLQEGRINSEEHARLMALAVEDSTQKGNVTSETNPLKALTVEDAAPKNSPKSWNLRFLVKLALGASALMLLFPPIVEEQIQRVPNPFGGGMNIILESHFIGYRFVSAERETRPAPIGSQGNIEENISFSILFLQLLAVWGSLAIFVYVWRPFVEGMHEGRSVKVKPEKNASAQKP